MDLTHYVREGELTAAQIDNLRQVLYTLEPREINKRRSALAPATFIYKEILKLKARHLAAEL